MNCTFTPRKGAVPWKFFFPGVRENAFTNDVWDSAEAIPTKFRTPLFPHQIMTPESRFHYSQRRGSTADCPCRQPQCVPLLRTSISTSAVPNENVVSRIRYRGESRAILCLLTYISHSHTMSRLPAEIPEHRN